MKETAIAIASVAAKGTAVSGQDLLHNWVALMLAGLGLSISGAEYLSGICLALALAAIARKYDPLKGRRLSFSTAVTAAVVATVTAMVVEHYFPDFPVQLAMAAAGFFSRNLVSMASRLGSRVEERQDDLLDRVVDKVLPGDDKK